MSKKYHWKMCGYFYEIKKETYQDYKKDYDKHRRLKKAEDEVVVLSYESLSNGNESGEKFMADTRVNVEEEVLQKIENEKLWEGLKKLSADDFFIISEYILKDKEEHKSLREIGEILNTSHTTVKKRKDKILDFLRDFLKN